MSQSDAALTDFIARVRTMGATVQDAAAREAAPLVSAEARRTAAAGTDPYGAPWRPKKDGTRAIPDAAAAVDAKAKGSVVVITVRRGAAIQNALSESVGRKVIPDATRPLPAGIAAALQEGARRAFRKSMST